MGTHKALDPARICRCSEMPAGTVLKGDGSDNEYIAHFEPVISVYDVCPLTRVVWETRHGGDWRISFAEYVHTGYRLPTPSVYTVAEVDAILYEVPSMPNEQVIFMLPRGTQLPEFPDLPLTGLIREHFFIRNRISWQWEIFQVSEEETSLFSWLYLWEPLDRGGHARGWLVDSFGVVSQQVLQPGLRLEWIYYAGRHIGEVLVRKQIQLETQVFLEVFGEDKPHRDLSAEFSDWLEKPRRRKRI